MFRLIQLMTSLSFLLGDIIDIESDKRGACKRGIKIVAATKTLKPGEFYVFEEWKAWLYDAENQNLLEHYDIEDKIRSDSHKEPIISASSVLTCDPSEGLSLAHAHIFTVSYDCDLVLRSLSVVSCRQKQIAYEFHRYEDFKNVSTWTSEDPEVLRKDFEAATDSKIKDFIDTVGIACGYDGQKTVQHVHNYKKPNEFLYNNENGENIQFYKLNIYTPYSYKRPIKESTSFPEALAFQFAVEQKNQAALFVYDNTIFYSTSDDGSHWVTTEANIEQVFGCKSSIVTVVVIFAAIVVFVVILFAVFAVTTLLRHHQKFEEDDSTVATVSNRKGQPKAIVPMK